MKTPFKLTAFLILASALAVALTTTGCGTLRGFGNDVETVGHGIEKSAR